MLQPVKGNSTLSSLSPLKAVDASPISKTENSSTETNVSSEDAADKSDTDLEEANGDAANMKDSNEEGLKSVINFLKERIPGFKVKALNVNGPEEIKVDTESLEQLVQEDDEETYASEDSKDEPSNLESIQQEAVPAGGGAESTEGSRNTTVKLFIGGVIHNKEDVLSKSYVRLPAEIKDTKKDSFVLQIPGGNNDPDDGERKAAKIKVAAIAAQAASDLMPSEVAKAFWGSDKATSKVSSRQISLCS